MAFFSSDMRGCCRRQDERATAKATRWRLWVRKEELLRDRHARSQYESPKQKQFAQDVVTAPMAAQVRKTHENQRDLQLQGISLDRTSTEIPSPQYLRHRADAGSQRPFHIRACCAHCGRFAGTGLGAGGSRRRTTSRRPRSSGRRSRSIRRMKIRSITLPPVSPASAIRMAHLPSLPNSSASIHKASERSPSGVHCERSPRNPAGDAARGPMQRAREEEIFAAGFRDASGQRAIAQRAARRHVAADQPGQQHAPRRTKIREQETARGENSRPDHAGHDQRSGAEEAQLSGTVHARRSERSAEAPSARTSVAGRMWTRRPYCNPPGIRNASFITASLCGSEEDSCPSANRFAPSA